jgi:Tfp pilus assembly protein PilN
MSAEPVREADRRKLNVIEALILASLIGVVGTLLALRQTVAEQAVAMKFQTEEIGRLRSELASVPAIDGRVSRLEVRVESLEEQLKENRQMRGLK